MASRYLWWLWWRLDYTRFWHHHRWNEKKNPLAARREKNCFRFATTWALMLLFKRATRKKIISRNKSNVCFQTLEASIARTKKKPNWLHCMTSQKKLNSQMLINMKKSIIASYSGDDDGEARATKNSIKRTYWSPKLISSLHQMPCYEARAADRSNRRKKS